MKAFIAPFFVFLQVVQGHYNFIRVQGSGIQASDWQYIRKVDTGPNGHIRDPLYPQDMDTDRIRCNRGGAKPALGIQSLPVKAGATIGFKINGHIAHQGPLMGYMAKVPAGNTAASWDASGKVWFKTSQDKIIAIADTPTGPAMYRNVLWENTDKAEVEYTIPKSLPNGEYLFRAEHIGLHATQYDEAVGGGPQFFVSCAHLLISGGGTGTPGPLVAFPGEYKKGDSGFLLHAYNTTLNWDDAMKYQPPGPPVWVS